MAAAMAPFLPKQHARRMVYDTANATVLVPDPAGTYDNLIKCPRCLNVFGPPIHDGKLEDMEYSRYRRGAKGHNPYARHLKSVSACAVHPDGGADVPLEELKDAINMSPDGQSKTKHKKTKLTPFGPGCLQSTQVLASLLDFSDMSEIDDDDDGLEPSSEDDSLEPSSEDA